MENPGLKARGDFHRDLVSRGGWVSFSPERNPRRRGPRTAVWDAAYLQGQEAYCRPRNIERKPKRSISAGKVAASFPYRVPFPLLAGVGFDPGQFCHPPF